MQGVRIGAVAVAVATAAAFAGTVYTDSTSFLGNVAAGYFLNDFASVTAGSRADITGSFNGFSYTISGAAGSLYGGNGIVSLDLSNDSIEVTFTGNPVTAIGGNFWATDNRFNSAAGDITILLSDGTSTTFSHFGPTDFRGFTSSVAISSVLVSSSPGTFATMDNLYVGTAISVVPVPTAAWAGLGLLGVMGGVRVTRRRA
jgi:hypothetical protein